MFKLSVVAQTERFVEMCTLHTNTLIYLSQYLTNEIKLIVKQILCIKLVKHWDKYTEMHGQQNVIKNSNLVLSLN